MVSDASLAFLASGFGMGSSSFLAGGLAFFLLVFFFVVVETGLEDEAGLEVGSSLLDSESSDDEDSPSSSG